MTDINLNTDWQMSTDSKGDVALCTGVECVIQNIRLEAVTQEGDLFYDTEYGWSLLDFIHTEESDIVNIEIKQRISDKLSKYEEIDHSSLNTTVTFENDCICITINFKLNTSDITFDVVVNRVLAEVIVI